MSTASAPDARRRAASPLHALPALDSERAGRVGPAEAIPTAPRTRP
ncbi:AraC family transcriptional regulator, partial [Clavibacter lycopersici]